MKFVIAFFWLNVTVDSLLAMIQVILMAYDAALCSWAGAIFWVVLVGVVQMPKGGQP